MGEKEDKITPLISGTPVTPASPKQKAHGHSAREVINSYLPITHWLPNYEFRENIMKDIACGITLGFVLIGQSLAHANLSKVSVIHGPYSCILAPIVYALFGTGLQASVGTGGLLALLTGTAMDSVSDNHDHAAGVLGLLVGLIMALMGVFQLSFLVRFLSRPALSGFVTGSALLIIKAMLIPFLGLPKEWEKEGYKGLQAHPERLLHVNPATLGVALVSFLFLFFSKKILPKSLKDLKELFVLAATAAFAYFYAEKYHVELVGNIPRGFPSIEMPIHSLSHLQLAKELLPEAALIALVCFISSFASAKKCGMKGGYHVDAFNELLALGLANMASAVSGGVPVQIGLSRSALASGMGVKTPLGSNIFVAAVVLGVLQIFGPALQFVPRCILNAIITNAAISLFEFHEAKQLFSFVKIKKSKDFIVWVFAFLGTVVLGAFEGILLAVAISLMMALRQIVNPKMDVLGKQKATIGSETTTRWVNLKIHPDADQVPGVMVVRLDGPLFYANSERFQDAISEMEMEAAEDGTPVTAIIFCASSIPFVDSTAVDVLKEMLASFKERNVKFYISGAYGSTREFFSHALADHLQHKDIRLSIDDCVDLVNLRGKQKRMSYKNRMQSIRSLPVF